MIRRRRRYFGTPSLPAGAAIGRPGLDGSQREERFPARKRQQRHREASSDRQRAQGVRIAEQRMVCSTLEKSGRQDHRCSEKSDPGNEDDAESTHAARRTDAMFRPSRSSSATNSNGSAIAPPRRPVSIIGMVARLDGESWRWRPIFWPDPFAHRIWPQVVKNERAGHGEYNHAEAVRAKVGDEAGRQEHQTGA